MLESSLRSRVGGSPEWVEAGARQFPAEAPRCGATSAGPPPARSSSARPTLPLPRFSTARSRAARPAPHLPRFSTARSRAAQPTGSTGGTAAASICASLRCPAPAGRPRYLARGGGGDAGWWQGLDGCCAGGRPHVVGVDLARDSGERTQSFYF
jgi:hypothetical protein